MYRPTTEHNYATIGPIVRPTTNRPIHVHAYSINGLYRQYNMHYSLLYHVLIQDELNLKHSVMFPSFESEDCLT